MRELSQPATDEDLHMISVSQEALHLIVPMILENIQYSFNLFSAMNSRSFKAFRAKRRSALEPHIKSLQCMNIAHIPSQL